MSDKNGNASQNIRGNDEKVDFHPVTAKPLTLECNIISQDHSRPIHEHEMIVSEDILRPTPLTNIQRGKRYGCKVVNIHDPNRIVAQVSYRLSHMSYNISWFLKGYLTFIFFVKGST